MDRLILALKFPMSQHHTTVLRIKQAEQAIAEELRKLYKDTGLMPVSVSLNDLLVGHAGSPVQDWILNGVSVAVRITL